MITAYSTFTPFTVKDTEGQNIRSYTEDEECKKYSYYSDLCSFE